MTGTRVVGLGRKLALAAAMAGLVVTAPIGRAADKPAGTGTGTTVKPRTIPARTYTRDVDDFPPGAWTDGQVHHLSDYRGKVLVLFFFDPAYLDGPGVVSKQLSAFDLFRDKPVAFLGIVCGNRDAAMTRSMLRNINVNAPMYIDNLGIATRVFSTYGEGLQASLKLVDPTGKEDFATATPQSVEKLLKDVKWKYRDGGYDARLNAIVEQLENGQYDAGLRSLKRMRKSTNKEVAASAEKLYQAVHAEGEQWQSDADGAKESDPVAAYDLYAKLAGAFAGEDLGKAGEEGLKALKGNKAVQDELSARRDFNQLYLVIPRAKPEQKLDVADFCDKLAKRYPGTPTGERAKKLSDNIISARGARGLN